MKNYYIASGLENVAQVRELKTILDDHGWCHTYDWTVHGSVAGQGEQAMVECASREVEGVYMADVVIVLLPGGRGTHVELGVALGLKDALLPPSDTRVVIYSPNPEQDFGTNRTTCAFYHHPLVERFSSMDEMIKSLLA